MLDDDTRLDPVGEQVFAGEITDRWSVVGPNGGYLATFILGGLMAAAPLPDPLTMTVHFLEPATPGAARVEVELIRSGRSHATLSARLLQGDVIAVALATFGRLRADAAHLVTAARPMVPAPEACDLPGDAPPAGITIGERFERRLPPRGHPRFGGTGDGAPVAGGWIRLRDRDLDDVAVPVFMDAWPASIWAATGQSAGAPTVELTMHWRAKPHTFWHLSWFSTPCLAGGYFVENGRLWGQDGTLVAESRQLARFVEHHSPGVT